MSQMHITIEIKGKDYQIPVIPEKISISDGANYARTVVLGLGETAFPGFRKVQEISWTSFFPYQYDAGYVNIPEYMMIHPLDFVDVFTQVLGRNGIGGTRPGIVRLKITEEYENARWATWINDVYSIESFNKEHDAGELTDIHYTITLRTATIPTLQTIGAVGEVLPKIFPINTGNTVTTTGPKVNDRPPGVQATTYSVEPGDTLSGIAGSKLGDSGRWNEIYNANLSLIGPSDANPNGSPDLIQVGWSLTLPSGAGSSGT